MGFVDTFDFNDGVAIQVGEDAIVSGNRISGTTASSVGVFAGPRSIVTGNVVRNMETNGITCSIGCLVSGNVVSDNGVHGIQTGTGSSVSDNTLIGNDGYGLLLTGSTGYRNNTIFVLPPASGTVNGGTNAGGNVCNSSLTCP